MSTPPVPAAPTPARTPPPEGRPALQELAELLLLRQRPAGVAIVGVLGLGLALAIAGVVPSGPVVGVVVGLLALVAALAAMLATDAVDPIVRGPRHLRVTGRTVVGRVGDEPTAAELEPVVDGLVQGLGAVRRIRVAAVGLDHPAGPIVDLLADGVAGSGRSVLVVDLTAGDDVPGITDVADGTHRLGDVATIVPGLQLARVGVGTGASDPLDAAAALAATPPSDLDLLLTLLPEDGRPGSGLLAGTDRVLAVVPLGRLLRDDVSRRLSLVEGARSTMATVVVVDPPDGGSTDDMTPQDAPLVAPLGERAGPLPVVDEPAAEPAEDEPAVAHDPAEDEPAVAHEPSAEPVAGGDPAVADESVGQDEPAADPDEAGPVDRDEQLPVAAQADDEPAAEDEPAPAPAAEPAPDGTMPDGEPAAADAGPVDVPAEVVADAHGPVDARGPAAAVDAPQDGSAPSQPPADESSQPLPGEVDATAELPMPLVDDVHLVDDESHDDPLDGSDDLLAAAALESLADDRED